MGSCWNSKQPAFSWFTHSIIFLPKFLFVESTVRRTGCTHSLLFLLLKNFFSNFRKFLVAGDVCGADSCCGPILENRLTSNSRVQLDKFLKDSLYRLSSILNTRAKRFDGNDNNNSTLRLRFRLCLLWIYLCKYTISPRNNKQTTVTDKKRFTHV